jgi:hypothetical protein
LSHPSKPKMWGFFLFVFWNILSRHYRYYPAVWLDNLSQPS